MIGSTSRKSCLKPRRASRNGSKSFQRLWLEVLLENRVYSVVGRLETALELSKVNFEVLLRNRFNSVVGRLKMALRAFQRCV